jgi:hypothetical protein
MPSAGDRGPAVELCLVICPRLHHGPTMALRNGRWTHSGRNLSRRFKRSIRQSYTRSPRAATCHKRLCRRSLDRSFNWKPNGCKSRDSRRCSLADYLQKNQEATTSWLQGLLFPEGALRETGFGTGHRLMCTSCSQELIQLQSGAEVSNDTSGLSGAVRSIRLRHRLSISGYTIPRGINIDFNQSVSRTTSYDCLAVLFHSHYHRSFIIPFLYFASIIHHREAAGHDGYNVVLTEGGFKLVYPWS